MLFGLFLLERFDMFMVVFGGGWHLPAGAVSLSLVKSTYFHFTLQVGEEELGGSVRSASVLSHYRGACSQHQVDFDAITI